MMATPDSARARRYLLGQSSEDECSLIEQEYFEHDEALEHIAAAEDDLIEDYLADTLSPADRDRFERSYLSTPQHRVRVETVRRLMQGAQAAQRGAATERPSSAALVGRHRQWLALAATLILIASVGLWMFSLRNRPTSEIATGNQPTAPLQQQPQERPAAPPKVFALVVSPAGVRSGNERAAVVVPDGTDVVAIRFESDGETRSLMARRAVVRTVGGREVWTGPVTAERPDSPGIVARIDVPAASLPGDDYLIALYGTDRSGTEREWAQYFLRVRGR